MDPVQPVQRAPQAKRPMQRWTAVYRVREKSTLPLAFVDPVRQAKPPKEIELVATHAPPAKQVLAVCHVQQESNQAAMLADVNHALLPEITNTVPTA